MPYDPFSATVSSSAFTTMMPRRFPPMPRISWAPTATRRNGSGRPMRIEASAMSAKPRSGTVPMRALNPRNASSPVRHASNARGSQSSSQELQARLVAELDVRQHDVRRRALDQFDSCRQVAGRADDAKIGLGRDDRCHARKDDLLIVDDYDRNRVNLPAIVVCCAVHYWRQAAINHGWLPSSVPLNPSSRSPMTDVSSAGRYGLTTIAVHPAASAAVEQEASETGPIRSSRSSRSRISRLVALACSQLRSGTIWLEARITALPTTRARAAVPIVPTLRYQIRGRRPVRAANAEEDLARFLAAVIPTSLSWPTRPHERSSHGFKGGELSAVAALNG